LGADLTIDDVLAGGKRALAHALAKLEISPSSAEIISLLDDAFAKPRAHVVGFTGPPGVGKSTLINGLIKQWRSFDKTVGVIAIDPSSHNSGGALLGDRTRMMTDPDDQGVFVRSLANRGQLGGLSELTFPVLVLMRALFDVVIIETVGVGQSEADITSHADSVVLCVQPGSGDSLQFMKSGIMEIPDIAVVTKADMEPSASRAFSDLTGALSLTETDDLDHSIRVFKVSALKNEGLEAFIEAIDGHFIGGNTQKKLETKRKAQAEKWLKGRICHDFGEKGFGLVADFVDLDDLGPFERQMRLMDRLFVALKP